jgi:predicted DNA-binding transcriptional regulator YafY
VELTYHSLERDEVNTRRVDPYRLLLFGGDPYLIARDDLRSDFRTFALGERMREVAVLDETYSPDPAFDLERYLAEGFGLFRGGTVAEVVLRFSPAVARYLREKVWDDTEVKEDLADGRLRLRMRVPVNTGLLRFVLQYGGEVEVEAPAGLRAQVQAEAARMGAIYGARRGKARERPRPSGGQPCG